METQTQQFTNGFASDFSIRVPQRGAAVPKYIFFAGDLIAPSVKASNPGWAAGGALRPGALTLSYCNHYIRQCQITQLRQHMEGVSSANIPPDRRRFMISNYQTQDDGVVKDLGLLPNGENDGLLRIPFYPIDEIDILTRQVDGIVEMPVRNAAEQRQAQLFLFPNWRDIVEGTASVPNKIADIRLHFQDRLKAAQALDDQFLINVANAAISSCINFQTWGQQQINVANAMYDEAKTKGWSWGYGADAEMLFAQLGIQRRDYAVQDQGAKLDTLIEAIAAGQAASMPSSARPAEPAIDAETKELLEFVKASKNDLIEFIKQRKGSKRPEGEAETASPPQAVADAPIQAGEAVLVDVGEGLDRLEGVVTERKTNGRLVVEFEDGTTRSFEKKQVERR